MPTRKQIAMRWPPSILEPSFTKGRGIIPARDVAPFAQKTASSGRIPITLAVSFIITTSPILR